MTVEQVSEREAALSIARRVIGLLESPVSNYQREMVLQELRKRFCLYCGGENPPCYCRRDE